MSYYYIVSFFSNIFVSQLRVKFYSAKKINIIFGVWSSSWAAAVATPRRLKHAHGRAGGGFMFYKRAPALPAVGTSNYS